MKTNRIHTESPRVMYGLPALERAVQLLWTYINENRKYMPEAVIEDDIKIATDAKLVLDEMESHSWRFL